jgi:hypothetical protein
MGPEGARNQNDFVGEDQQRFTGLDWTIHCCQDSKVFHTYVVRPRHAQAVSRWIPTAAARGSSRGLVMWDFVVDKVALGQVFSEYFGFPCQISFHQLLHNHPHLSSGFVE